MCLLTCWWDEVGEVSTRSELIQETLRNSLQFKQRIASPLVTDRRVMLTCSVKPMEFPSLGKGFAFKSSAFGKGSYGNSIRQGDDDGYIGGFDLDVSLLEYYIAIFGFSAFSHVSDSEESGRLLEGHLTASGPVTPREEGRVSGTTLLSNYVAWPGEAWTSRMMRDDLSYCTFTDLRSGVDPEAVPMGQILRLDQDYCYFSHQQSPLSPFGLHSPPQIPLHKSEDAALPHSLPLPYHPSYSPPLDQMPPPPLPYFSSLLHVPPLSLPLTVIDEGQDRRGEAPLAMLLQTVEVLRAEYGFVALWTDWFRHVTLRGSLVYGITIFMGCVVEDLTEELRLRTGYSTRQLIETEAGMSREAWRRAMDSSDLAYGGVISLCTTVHSQISEITELQSADCRRTWSPQCTRGGDPTYKDRLIPY
ncbi:hypothetical protein Tco_1121580 [Tanacetum coccineum]|uniref:Uncharacterized protein n=1 Tax=Tanacetum coccineum TaxID=301880 RepID=A0ABQ5IZM7_9ASTR